MRIGYSCWGLLGPDVLDVPAGSPAIRPTETPVFAHYDDTMPLSAELDRDVSAEPRCVFVGQPATPAYATAWAPRTHHAIYAARPTLPRLQPTPHVGRSPSTGEPGRPPAAGSWTASLDVDR